MNLLYITQYYPPEVGAGAVRSNAMVRYLSKQGWNIDVLTEIPNYPTGIIPESYRNEWFVREHRENATIHRVWVLANKRDSTIKQLLFFISFMVNGFIYALARPKKFDLIYVTSPPIFAGIAGGILSKIFNTKLVLEVRDLWPDSAVDSQTLQSKSFFIKTGRVIEKWLYNLADLIVPVTPQSEKIIQTKCNGTPTTVIENGVDLDLFKKIENPHKHIDEDFDINKFRVGYVGSLGVIHDLHTFVEAAKLCEDDPDIEFVIVGDGGQNNQLQNILKKHDPSNVQWVGLKKHEQIPSYISSFDVAINPINDSKVFQSIVTVKFYEYLACETPVINLARGALEEIGNRSKSAITLPVGNAYKLADTVKELKQNQSKLEKLAQNARDFVRENYSREELAVKLSDRLKTLID